MKSIFYSLLVVRQASRLAGVTCAILFSLPQTGVSGQTFSPSRYPKNQVIATVGVGSEPTQLVIGKKNDFVYVANTMSGTITVINTGTNRVAFTFAAGSTPADLALTPDGATLYVMNATTSGKVSVFAAATGALIQTVAVGTQPSSLVISPNGTQVYVTNSGDGSISIIDTATNQVLTSPIQVGGYLVAVAFAPGGKYAYVSNDGGAGYLSLIDVLGQTVLTSTGGEICEPGFVTISTDGQKVYLTDCANYLAVIDAATARVTKAIWLGTPVSAPGSNNNTYLGRSAITPDGHYLYVPIIRVPDDDGTTVVMIETDTEKVAGQPITVGGLPSAVAVAPTGARAYVANQADNTVSIIDITLQSIGGE